MSVEDDGCRNEVSVVARVCFIEQSRVVHVEKQTHLDNQNRASTANKARLVIFQLIEIVVFLVDVVVVDIGHFRVRILTKLLRLLHIELIMVDEAEFLVDAVVADQLIEEQQILDIQSALIDQMTPNLRFELKFVLVAVDEGNPEFVSPNC